MVLIVNCKEYRGKTCYHGEYPKQNLTVVLYFDITLTKLNIAMLWWYHTMVHLINITVFTRFTLTATVGKVQKYSHFQEAPLHSHGF